MTPAAATLDGKARPPGDPTPAPLRAVDRSDVRPTAGEFDRFERVAAREGRVTAIVGFPTEFAPAGLLTKSEARAQELGIVHARRVLVDELRGTGVRVVRSFRYIPFVALSLTPRAIDRLRGSEHVATIDESHTATSQLDASTKIVEATETATLGRGGTGQEVVVIDSGVDRNHPFLQRIGGSKVVSEACFSSTNSCPNGTTEDTGIGSGAPCGYASDCDHGTHVAGIAAGDGANAGVSFSGVAPGANIIAIRATSPPSSGNRASYAEPDWLKALERVQTLAASRDIAAVNMSFGGPPVGSGNCDEAAAATKAAIDSLLSLEIPTVIASGNNGSSTGVGTPACISTAVTVGSTTDSDTVSSFSNSSNVVDLLAPGGGNSELDDPGTPILSSISPGFDDADPATPIGFANKQGTSMAAPHVVGAFAVLRGIDNQVSPYTSLSYLQQTGRPVTDPFNNVTVPRIRVLAASVMLADTGFKPGGSFTYAGGDVATGGAGAARRGGASGENAFLVTVPLDATIKKVFLYWSTLGGPDGRVILSRAAQPTPVAVLLNANPECPNSLWPIPCGALIGASQDTGWYLNQQAPNRVYRSPVPKSLVRTGTQTYSVSGLGTRNGGVDGQGASLVVLYSQPSVPGQGRIQIRHGSMTATYGETMQTSFTGLTVPANPSQVALHVGVADGQSGGNGSEDPMLFNGNPVTGANAFFGAQGPFWDSMRITLPNGTLPAGTTTRTNSLKTLDDGLAWAYSILAYRHP